MQPDSIPLLPIRDQGKRGTCLAFAASAAHEYLHGIGDYLSPAYLYSLAWPTDSILDGHNGLTVKAVSNAISKIGQIHESILPYDHWVENDFPHAVHRPKDPHFFSDLSLLTPSFKVICNYLEEKTPVIIGLHITEAFHRLDKSGYVTETGEREMDGHAVVAVGIHKDSASKKFILIRNSWGMTWGKQGHALISEAYIMNRLIFAAILKNKET